LQRRPARCTIAVHDENAVDLARPFRKSSEFVFAAVDGIRVLGAIALIVWAVTDAVAVHRLPAGGPAWVAGISLL
jgi:hypothetical protein